MAPVPTHVIIWGFVIGGVGRSILVGALVTIISLFLCHCTLFLADGHHDFIDDSDSFSLGLLNGILRNPMMMYRLCRPLCYSL